MDFSMMFCYHLQVLADAGFYGRRILYILGDMGNTQAKIFMKSVSDVSRRWHAQGSRLLDYT